MMHVPTAIYIDTEVFVRNGLRFDTNQLRSIRDVFVKGGLRLLVPSMMERELTRHFRRRSRETAESLFKAHKEYSQYISSVSLPSKQDLEEQCFEALQKKWQEFKGHFIVEDLPLAGKLEDIVDWYFAIEAPFSTDKKKEFPDAFILSALEAYFLHHSVRIAVVSFDGDFSRACIKRRDIIHFPRLQEYIDAFQPELTKASSSEPVDPTRPITTEELTEMKAILGRGAGVTPIERDRAINLISTRGTNYEYFFRNANEAFWLDSLRDSGFFSNPPPIEKTGNGRIKLPFWSPMDYLVRILKDNPEKVLAIIDSLPDIDNPRILEGIMQIIVESNDPELMKRFYGRIERYLDSGL